MLEERRTGDRKSKSNDQTENDTDFTIRLLSFGNRKAVVVLTSLASLRLGKVSLMEAATIFARLRHSAALLPDALFE